MRQRFDEGAHRAAILGALDNKNGDLFEAGGNGLFDAPMTGIDDIAVAAVSL
ncbi:hypothetical protein ACVME8_010493 [Bradyrhizobium diazoefficiens]